MNDVKKRNDHVDIIRGIAILMVVLGHTMSTTAQGYADNWLYNIIWSLQMPLFFVISGYVTRYGKNPSTFKKFIQYLLKKAGMYMLPWAIWTFFVRALLMRETKFLDIKYLLFNMDSGYWFLVSLFVICIIYLVSNFVAQKLTKKKVSHNILLVALFAILTVALAAIGLLVGINFLGIKLTLYYIPFFLAGWFYGQIQEKILRSKGWSTALDMVVAISAAAYFFFIFNVNVFGLDDGIKDIVIRAVISSVGCVAVCGLIAKFPVGENKICGSLLFFGKHSLEIYLVHYIFLAIVKFDGVSSIGTLLGTVTVIFAYLCIIALSCLTVYLLNNNRFLKKILFWK